jgi:hypothetical protein
VIDPLIEPVPVFGQSLDDPHYAGRQHMVGMARMRGNTKVLAVTLLSQALCELV